LDVLRPLRPIIAQIQALLSGKPYKRIYSQRIDEIGVISHFFNQVTKGLGKVSVDLIDRERMVNELEIASQLQRDILPLKSPIVPGLQIIAKTKPATELGGDSFDIVNVKGKTYVYMGDVTGHGVAAGLVMTMVNSFVSVFSNIYGSAYDIMVNVNKTVKKHVKKSMFMTMVMLSWDQVKKEMTYVGAGHEYILVFRPDSGLCDSIMSGGVAIGMIMDNSKVISEKKIELKNGDYILLYSDGITEARNKDGELYGIERLKEAFKEYASQYSAEGVNFHIAKDVSNFMRGHEQLDDMTLIVMKVTDEVFDSSSNDVLSTEW
jgi:serine phosphatase RsbU (regulator of sigma subunit)